MLNKQKLKDFSAYAKKTSGTTDEDFFNISFKKFEKNCKEIINLYSVRDCKKSCVYKQKIFLDMN